MLRSAQTASKHVLERVGYVGCEIYYGRLGGDDWNIRCPEILNTYQMSRVVKSTTS